MVLSGILTHVYVAVLLIVVVALTCAAPRLLPRLKALRSVPAAGLALWQSVSLAGVLGGLLAAPLAVLVYVRARSGDADPSAWEHLWLLLAGLTLSGILLARLLVRGHRVGRSLRGHRRAHTAMVDLIGLDAARDPRLVGADSRRVRVLVHPTPTAYCVPGAAKRVVLTQGALDALDDDQLLAVLAHERSHLRWRHDLVLEFFTVLHTAVPRQVRCDRGLDEVKLLIELLADKWAVTVAGRRPLATALLALAEGRHPQSTLGSSDAAVVRVEQLADGKDRRWLRVAVIAAAVLVVQMPVLLAIATVVDA